MRIFLRFTRGCKRIKMTRLAPILIAIWLIVMLYSTAMWRFNSYLSCPGYYDNETMVGLIASNIHIEYHVIDNKDGCVQQIIIINKGCENITADEDWAIHFYSFGLIEAKSYPYTDGLLFLSAGVRIYHLSGYLYKLTPDKKYFENLVRNANISIKFTSRNFISTKTDILPNWYVTAENIPPRIIQSTLEAELKKSISFVNVSSMMRYENDKTRRLTVKDRYELNDDTVIDLGRAPNSIIPTPYNMTIEHKKYLVMTSNWVVVESKYFVNEVKYLTEELSISTLNIRPGHSFIQFKKLKSNISFITNKPHRADLSNESYELTVDPDLKRITIRSFTNAGAFYAIQSLLSVRTFVDGQFIIPKLTIRDQPRFGYRGFHLDVARNFRKKSEVLKILNIMAMYKLNKFHFHLTDDEGWRLEIPELPELTQFGAYRCHGDEETECLSSQLGGGPFKVPTGSGYYSVRDYQDILRHANKLHIQVIPEFDMPGHARAAIKSMEYRYNKLKEQNITAAAQFLLSELGDQSSYKSIQSFTDNAMNPCIESTYTFISHLVREVKRMHESIQPLQYFHFGGDEVPDGAWENSTACTSSLKIFKRFTSVKDFKDDFIRRVLSVLQSENLMAGAWEDGLAVNNKHLNRSLLSFPGDIYAYAWNNVWEWRRAHVAHNLANDGFKVVLAHATHLYLDHPYESDLEERGLSWATRKISTRDVFNYMPLNLYGNADITMAGQPVGEWMLTNSTLEKPENVVGIQAQLWSETVRTESHMDYMLFPRLIAYAERAWHHAEWEETKNQPVRHYDWIKFANTLGYRELKKLDKMNIRYRIPPPGAVVVSGQLLANTEIPGLTVEYSMDGIIWKKVGLAEMVPEDKKILLRTSSADGKRYSRIVTWCPKYKPPSTSTIMLETLDKSKEDFMFALYST